MMKFSAELLSLPLPLPPSLSLSDSLSQGLTTLKVLPSDDILAGTGDGTVVIIRPESYKKHRLVPHCMEYCSVLYDTVL